MFSTPVVASLGGTPSTLALVPETAEALVNLPDDGSRLWFLARLDRALFFFPYFVIFLVPEVVADELAQADDSRWWRTWRRKQSRQGGGY
jgi:hypothetical protein